MTLTDAEIRQRLRLGEDSGWEFKQVKFVGTRPASPSRDALAAEMIAFANASGGWLLMGVTDDGVLQGMSGKELAALNDLLVSVSTDAIKPALRIEVHHRELDGKAFALVEVPRGDSLHELGGRSWIRVGASTRRLTGDEPMRLAQRRAQSRYLSPDEHVVPGTGFDTLSERLWERLLSVTGAADPRMGLRKLRLLAEDDAGVDRATVAGVLFCARDPEEWLRHAMIVATHYRGRDRASGQLDAQEIGGPLPLQIADAVKFVVRNMRVAARKVPERVEMPQYSAAAVFEAVVNAVAHRDYSIASRRIRLSMFADRLEIDSPGSLANGMTIEAMDASQATRNEVVASVFGRIPVGDIPGSGHRRYLMERRGDGVAIILRETRETAGEPPEYALVNQSNLVLRIPSARLDVTPARAAATVRAEGEPLPGVDVLAVFPNGASVRATTDEAGKAALDLYATHLPMTVYAAAPSHAAGLRREWRPDREDLTLELTPLPQGGATIFAEGSGHLPGLRGRVDADRDTSDRTLLYSSKLTIDEGREQPVPFRLGKPLRLTDAFGTELWMTIIDIAGRSVLVEHRPCSADAGDGAE